MLTVDQLVGGMLKSMGDFARRYEMLQVALSTITFQQCIPLKDLLILSNRAMMQKELLDKARRVNQEQVPSDLS